MLMKMYNTNVKNQETHADSFIYLMFNAFNVLF